MNRWEKAQTLATIFSLVAAPLVLAAIGYYFNTSLKEREVQGKFVELAVVILQQPPQEQSRPLRNWATRVIDKYSGVPLSAQLQELLIQKSPLPSWGTEWSPNYKDFEPIPGSVLDNVRMLRALGYLAISAGDLKNPRATPEAGEAIRRFQQDHGLKVTGSMNEESYMALRKDFEQQLATKGTTKR